jgi:hypothetical protein
LVQVGRNLICTATGLVPTPQKRMMSNRRTAGVRGGENEEKREQGPEMCGLTVGEELRRLSLRPLAIPTSKSGLYYAGLRRGLE